MTTVPRHATTSGAEWTAAVALDVALDRFGHTPSCAPGSSTPICHTPDATAELVATFAAVRSRSAAVPNPEFATTLRQSLLHAAASSQPSRRDPIPSTPVIAATALPDRSVRSAARPFARAFAVSTVSLLILTLVAGSDRFTDATSNLFGGPTDPNPRQSEPAPISIAAPAIATPSPASQSVACTAPIPDLQSLAATVNAQPDTTGITASPTPFSIVAAQRADAAVTEGVVTTIQLWFACANAGESSRLLGLYTDDLIVRLMAPMATQSEWSPDLAPEPRTPTPPSEEVTIETIGPVQVLSDGRASVEVTAFAGIDRSRTQVITFILEEESEQWRIDELFFVVDDGLLDTTGSSPPAAEGALTAVTRDAAPSPTPATALTNAGGDFASRQTVTLTSDNVNFRDAPNFDESNVIQQLETGDARLLAGPAVVSDGIMWYPVERPVSGASGYVVTEFLESDETTDPTLTASPESAPSATVQITPNFPDGAIVRSRLDPIVLRSIPRTIGEHIARLSGARTLVVTGPVTDSGDGIWVGVTDQETGVFGYLSIADLVPPAPRPSSSNLFGQSFVSTAPTLLRASPELAALANPPIPTGSPVTITGETIYNGLVWLSVESPEFGGKRWLLPDTLAIAPGTFSVSPPTPHLAFPMDATVAVGEDGKTVILRALPRTYAEDIARLPGQRNMRVAGPLADSTDNLWLPVIDTESGVFGYVNLDLVTPPGPINRAPIEIGTTHRVTTDSRIRPQPEATSTPSVTLAPGNDLVVTATKLSRGVPWVEITVASTDVIGWLPADVLITSTNPQEPPSPDS